jgi:hypothetical protein
MSDLSKRDSEQLALAHWEVRKAINRCDELIERADREISRFGQRHTRPALSRLGPLP